MTRGIGEHYDGKMAVQIYQTTRWRKLRVAYLALHQICQHCGAPAEHVDHIVPITDGGDPYSDDNLQALCLACHIDKTNDDIGVRKIKRAPGMRFRN